MKVGCITIQKIYWFISTRVHRGWCKKNYTNVFLYIVFNTFDYTFLCFYTQSTHFDNSKMVNWVNLVQKLTKIQGIMKNLNSWNIEVFVIKLWFLTKTNIFHYLNFYIFPCILVNFWTRLTQFTILELSMCVLWVYKHLKASS